MTPTPLPPPSPSGPIRNNQSQQRERLNRLQAQSPKPGKRNSILFKAGIAVAAIGVIVLYSLVDPSVNPYPRCSFKMLTGLSCPGCGSQRALHALLNGNIQEAIRFNALFVIEIPLIGLLLLSQIPGKRLNRFRQISSARTFILLILATIIIWTVVRNILEI